MIGGQSVSRFLVWAGNILTPEPEPQSASLRRAELVAHVGYRLTDTGPLGSREVARKHGWTKRRQWVQDLCRLHRRNKD